MKIAKYKILSLDFESIDEVNEYKENSDDYVRLTEIIEIDFKPLQDEEIIKKQVDFIDNQIKTVQAASELKVNELKQQKAELLSLPNLSAS